MAKTLGDYIVLIITIIGSLASIIAFWLCFSPHLNNQGTVGVLFLGVISLFFLVYNYYLILMYRKKVRYADIFADLNMGFSQLHEVDRLKSQDVEVIIRNLSNLCDSLAIAFTKIYDVRVGVCIKYLENKETRPLVQTLVRDSYSKTNQRKTGTSDKTQHWLDGNSDFEFIYSKFDDDSVDTSFYHEAKLPVCKDYKNTRLSSSWLPKRKYFIWENCVRRRYWPLPYKSTLVVPIVPLLANEQSQDRIRGFLCIDSPTENCFCEKIDIDILKGVSDGLYNQIDILHDQISILNLNKHNEK